MNRDRPPKPKHRQMRTLQDQLEEQATQILKEDRKRSKCAGRKKAPSGEIDLDKNEDARRKTARRYNLARQHGDIMLSAPVEYRQSPEERLMRAQDILFYRAFFLRLVENFERDKVVKSIIAAILLHDLRFKDTTGIAKKTGLTAGMVHAGKERLRYFARNSGRSLFDVSETSR